MTRTVLVTGSSGGIGSAIAAGLVDQGWSVVGVDLVPDDDDGWPTYTIDLADADAGRAAVEAARTHGPLSGIVHAAAFQPIAAAGATSNADWHHALQVNLVVLDEMVGAAIADLEATRGAVLAVSSVHAVATSQNIAAYAASKAALCGWVRAAAIDLGPQGVRINALLPGAVDTAMLRAGLERSHIVPDQAREALRTRTPLRAIAQPQEIAGLAVALLDPKLGSFVTGAAISADGGALARLGTE